MIFITVGSQKFQFNRLLQEIDELIATGTIVDEVFAQTGYCDYEPKNFSFAKFLSREEFAQHIKNSDLVITHGGSGAIIGALKQGKKVIAVPRLEKFQEHVDNHQQEIVDEFKDLDLIIGVTDIKQLATSIEEVKTKTFKKYESSTDVILEKITSFIGGL